MTLLPTTALQSLAHELGPDHLIQTCNVTDATAVPGM